MGEAGHLAGGHVGRVVVVRGGGGLGGGAMGGQLMELLGVLASSRLDTLLMIIVGVVLMALIIQQMLSVKPAQPRVVQRSTTCLLCGGPLSDQETYVDRHFPNWTVCSACYTALAPGRRRQYRVE
jgi:hypothetical protein